MTDVVNRETRSRMRSGIRGKNTRPELIVRRYLHCAGLRYRLHDRSLPGAPDLVFRSRSAVVFVHGCFWHQHAGCRFAVMPKQNRPFWRRKLLENVKRDQENVRELQAAGWRVYVVWECDMSAGRLRRLAQDLESVRPDEPARQHASSPSLS
jgi:DNA mismatch endonuclease, patch repair protein